MKNQTALLVIDVQNELFNEKYENDAAVLARIVGLIERAREQQIPVVYLQHEEEAPGSMEHGKQGWQLHPLIAPQPNDIVIPKRASDAFYETDLHEKLQDLGIQRLIITGAQTEFCVDATCRRAASFNYDVYLVADGHNTGDTEALSATQIIAHHNQILAWLAHPSHPIQVQPAAEIRF